MVKQTKPLETATRKEIDQMLDNLGWKTKEFVKGHNVTTERVKTEEQNKKLKKISGYKKPPDYVLYETNTDNPIAVIEAKRKGQNVDDALKQAIEKYAIPLGVKIVFAYDGAFFKSWHIDHKRELQVDGEVITSLLTESKTLRFVNEGYNISEITSKVKHSRSELITVFKASNNLLRKEGLREGLERFNEFSNILFLKLVSEIEEDREKRGEDRIIDESFCWNQFNKKPAKEMYNYVNDSVLKELKTKYGEIFDERLKIKPNTLKIIVDKLSKINLMNTDSDVKGDAFEYFLKASITVGNDLGEYFTPRHIVKLMINLVEPKIGEKIYDPACGTGGFLISTFNYIKERSAKKEDVIKTLKKDTVYGGELTGTAKIAKMNMIITGDGHTNIEQHDSLDNPIDGKYDVVISNPPYGQTTDYGNHYPIVSSNGDVVFIQHIVKSLIDGGRAAIVIPEGSLFRPHDDYDLREWLVKNTNIESIISLPSGVFRPYAKNKTDIIILRKDTKGTKSIWFYDLQADGFELNSDFRRPIDNNDISHLLSNWNEKQETEKSWNVSRETIEENDYDLLPRTYKQNKEGNENLEKLSSLLIPIQEKITIDDEQDYKQIRVKWYGGGAVLRHVLKGNKILTKKQYIARKNNVIVSKIDARKGAIAIVSDELDGAVVSSDFPLFEINTDKIDIEYLDFCLRYGDHLNILSDKSKGTTNRQRIKIDAIMNLSIFVPTNMEQQKEIVEHLKNQESLKIGSERLITKMEETGIDDIFFKLSSKKLIPFTQNVTINPHYNIPKSKGSSNVLEMENVDSYNGSIGNFILKNSITSTCKFKNNDIIFAKMTSGKKIKVAHIDCLNDGEVGFGSSEFLVFKPDETKILPEWIFFFCKSNYIRTRVKSTIRGTTRNRIPPNFFDTIKIPDITKDEQKNILKDLKKYTDAKKPLEDLIYVSDKTIHDTIKNLFV